MDFSALLAQSEVVVLVFLLLCFVGLLLIFYITYRALSNLREELQDQIDIASARLERLERSLPPSAAAALNDTQGAQSLDELLDDESSEPPLGPHEEVKTQAAHEPAAPGTRAEEHPERTDTQRRSQIDSEELALLEAEALSGQLRDGVFGVGGSAGARPAWDQDSEAGIPATAAVPMPEEETDWGDIDLSETSIEFDDTDLEDERELQARSSAPAEAVSHEEDEPELLLDLSEESSDARVESEMDDSFGEEEGLLLDDLEGDEIAAANEWSEPLEKEEELVFEGMIDFEDISKDDLAVGETEQAVDAQEQEVQLTFEEPAGESLDDELSLGAELIFDELEEPAAEEMPPAAETEEQEGALSLDEDLIFEESVEPAAEEMQPAAEAEEQEDAISLDEDLIFEESVEPAAEEMQPAAETEESEDALSLDEDLIFEESVEPASEDMQPAAEAEEQEGALSLDEDLIFEESVEPAAEDMQPAAEAEESEDALSLDEDLIFEESVEPAAEDMQPAAEAEEQEGALSLDEDLIFEEPVEPASEEMQPAAEAEEQEDAISLDEDLIFEESVEPASEEMQPELQDTAARIFDEKEPTIAAAPSPISDDVDEELVFEGLSEGFATESSESEIEEPSLSGAMLLDENEGAGSVPAPETQQGAPAESKLSKRVVSIEDDDYEFDNPSETMILLDEDMGPARRAFVEEEEEQEGEALGGHELFEAFEQEGESAGDFAAVPPETLFWTGDDDAPIYFGDEGDAESEPNPATQVREAAAEYEAPRETPHTLLEDDEAVEAVEPAVPEQSVLDEGLPEQEPEDLDLDVELALNETFLEEDLVYLEGLMQDTHEAEAKKAGAAVQEPAGTTQSSALSMWAGGEKTDAEPSADDEEIVFDDIGKLGAREVKAPAEQPAADESEDFTLEDDSIEFEMPLSPEPSATSYTGDDDDIFFEDEAQAKPRPQVSYEAKIEPLRDSAPGAGEEDVDYDMVIDFEEDIAALEDLLDQSKNKPGEE